jgi:hypothetical protein
MSNESLEAIERENKRVASEQRKKRRVMLDNFRAICKQPAGRDVIWEILEFCSPYVDAYAADGDSALNYRTGRQSVGKFIITELMEADPSIYPLMLKEKSNVR